MDLKVDSYIIEAIEDIFLPLTDFGCKLLIKDTLKMENGQLSLRINWFIPPKDLYDSDNYIEYRSILLSCLRRLSQSIGKFKIDRQKISIPVENIKMLDLSDLTELMNAKRDIVKFRHEITNSHLLRFLEKETDLFDLSHDYMEIGNTINKFNIGISLDGSENGMLVDFNFSDFYFSKNIWNNDKIGSEILNQITKYFQSLIDKYQLNKYISIGNLDVRKGRVVGNKYLVFAKIPINYSKKLKEMMKIKLNEGCSGGSGSGDIPFVLDFKGSTKKGNPSQISDLRYLGKAKIKRVNDFNDVHNKSKKSNKRSK